MENTLNTSQTLDEIVFEKRNKAYGAFQLRQHYNRIIRNASLIGSTIFTLALLAPLLYAKIVPNEKKTFVVLKTTDVKMPEPPKQEEVKLPEPPKVDVPVKTKAFLPPEITAEPNVEDQVPPTKEELKDALIGDKDIEGVNPNEVAEVIVDETAPKAVEPVKVEVEDKPFIHVEQDPAFVGGWAEFRKFLEKNLKYPPAAQKANVEGKVIVTFVVSKTGELSSIELLKGIGFGCDEEAMRVVRLMPKWSPGKQSGRAVPVRFTLPIGFALQ